MRARAEGWRDAAARLPMTAATVTQAASLGKMMTAWLVLRLAEGSRIDLDAPVQRYVQRYRLPRSTFEADEVTARRILAHIAGLSVPDYPGFDPSVPLPTLVESLHGKAGEVAPLILQQKPGEIFQYSGAGYTLLQLLIEDVTGHDFATHARTTLFEPLGLASCSFAEPVAGAVVAQGHDAGNRTLPFYRYRAAAAAGLLATAGDLARFLATYFPGPRGEPPGRGVISPATVTAMLTPVVETGRADGLWAQYGLGHEIEAGLAGHHGINRGWRALAAVSVERQAAFAALANGDAGEPAIDAAFRAWRAENRL